MQRIRAVLGSILSAKVSIDFLEQSGSGTNPIVLDPLVTKSSLILRQGDTRSIDTVVLSSVSDQSAPTTTKDQ